ncbi:manganese efflux pump MntP family protein [Halarcobacter ebronensis]|uniref:Putative manganese efflux pump MntP n=1 Tax=Halarcobacter ebronensis TaxID=1462615 RepID=A0A4Q1APZ8_9BACT|nr:manganese efflux pump [Halarcobacter ebronensis]QKF82737.1 manganese efflux pump MntP [Halarcobacter ebronensis]RXK06762.1 manganese efflux pump MntP [Halarcobacter ebronensis]
MIELLLLALALSMDAFAVSIGLGIKNTKNIKILAIKTGLFFGMFQALMPFIGYMGGVGLKQYIQGYDSIIAFILLLIIGSKMIYESFGENIEEDITLISNKLLLILAIATSIDAMAAGFTLHLLNVTVYTALFIIGVTTFFISIFGIYIGKKGGNKYESKAELLGGLILILIGFKILLL